jgi:hypothetical protein
MVAIPTVKVKYEPPYYNFCKWNEADNHQQLMHRILLSKPMLQRYLRDIIGSQEMYVDFIVVSESEIALNTRAWKLSRSRDARVGIFITMIHRIYIYIYIAKVSEFFAEMFSTRCGILLTGMTPLKMQSYWLLVKK